MTQSYVAPMVVSLTIAVAGCGPPPLAHGHRSANDLGRAVLDALARNDVGALRTLAISEQEFRAHVWPSLPAARPERNLPFSYVWSDLRQKSDTLLGTTLASHGGRRYQLTDLRFTDVPLEYAAFRIHRAAIFVVRDATNAIVELRLCGSLIEKDAAWKVFSYVVDD